MPPCGRPRHRRWLVVDPHDARPGGTGCTLPCKRAAQSELVCGEAAFWCRHETQSPSRRVGATSASKHETFSQPAHALTHTMPGQAEGTLVARSFRCRCAPRLVGCGAAWPRVRQRGAGPDSGVGCRAPTILRRRRHARASPIAATAAAVVLAVRGVGVMTVVQLPTGAADHRLDRPARPRCFISTTHGASYCYSNMERLPQASLVVGWRWCCRPTRRRLGDADNADNTWRDGC